MVDREELELILKNFLWKGKFINLREAGILQDLIVKADVVGCVVNVSEDNADFIKDIDLALQEEISKVKNVCTVNVVFTGLKDSEPTKVKLSLPDIKKVILVSSGKGGVGKSTIAFWVTLALQKQGLKVGLLDADIYGPSLPTMTNYHHKPEMLGEKMIPHDFRDVRVNSIGYLIPEEKALVWRGPMVTKALYQLITNTNWGELDFLVVDMPPGTGDIHLTLCEKYTIDGVLIVSTPHELAIADVSRVIDMYKKFSLPILGIIKNMSYVEIGGERNYIFGKGELLSSYSSRVGVPIIEEIPIDKNMSSFTAKDFSVLNPISNIAKKLMS